MQTDKVGWIGDSNTRVVLPAGTWFLKWWITVGEFPNKTQYKFPPVYAVGIKPLQRLLCATYKTEFGSRSQSLESRFQLPGCLTQREKGMRDAEHAFIVLDCGLDGKESACSAGDPGLITELGRAAGGGHGSLPQASCLGSRMDRGAWRAAVHGATKSPTRLGDQAPHGPSRGRTLRDPGPTRQPDTDTETSDRAAGHGGKTTVTQEPSC